MSKQLPKTAADARALLSNLQAKRTGLNRVVENSAQKRSGHAVAAEFGDAPAAETLREAEAEETQARAALVNLDIVIADMAGLRDRLSASEALDRDQRAAQELSDAIDELLEIDDKIDDALDLARTLLLERDELARSGVIRRGRTKLNGALVTESQQVGRSLLAYFDKWLPETWGATYAAITRIADWDGRNCARVSPRSAERGPREPTMLEKNMRRSTMSPLSHSFGFDSTVEAAKNRANRDGIDVSGGMMRQSGRR